MPPQGFICHALKSAKWKLGVDHLTMVIMSRYHKWDHWSPELMGQVQSRLAEAGRSICGSSDVVEESETLVKEIGRRYVPGWQQRLGRLFRKVPVRYGSVR